MKKIALIIITLFTASSLFAQADTSRIEQYCQVIVTPKLLSNKVTVDIDFGEEKSFWRDNRLKTYEGKLKKFNTVIDAMNFMAKDGWKFINAYPVNYGNTTIYHFAFRKEFLRTEVF
jgi:hypothetical protein